MGAELLLPVELVCPVGLLPDPKLLFDPELRFESEIAFEFELLCDAEPFELVLDEESLGFDDAVAIGADVELFIVYFFD